MATKSSRSIRIKTPALPHEVTETLQKIRSSGYETYLAGGCVRDLLLKRPPKDWDVVSNAPLDALKTMFPNYLEVGVSFGILKLPPKNDILIDVAMFREEEGYSDLRRPDRVTIGDLKTDQSRRDFTINALYLDFSDSSVVDGVGGMADLKKKIIRTVGNPKDRFSEDALRILRAARFAAQLGFRIEPKTKAAMKKCAPLLKAISRERVREETMRALSSTHAREFLILCAEQRLWEHVFGKSASAAMVRLLKKLPAKTQPLSPLWWLGTLELAGLIGDTRDLLRLSSVEYKKLSRASEFFKSVAAVSSNPALKLNPQHFVELEKSDRGFFGFIYKMSAKLKPVPQLATKHRRAAMRQLEKIASEKVKVRWPQAHDFLDKGVKPGPELGELISRKSWDLFWNA